MPVVQFVIIELHQSNLNAGMESFDGRYLKPGTYANPSLGNQVDQDETLKRVVGDVADIDEGATVQSIALELGYGTASAFIVMFQRRGGMSPEQYRRDRARHVSEG